MNVSFLRRVAVVMSAFLGCVMGAAAPVHAQATFAGLPPAEAATGPGGASNELIPDTMAARTAACTGCHGQQGRAGSDGYYPRLAGKPQEYLYHQLLNFRDGRRGYRPMEYLLQNMPDAYLRDIAGYFADQVVPYPPPQGIVNDRATIERGRRLTVQGDPARGLPACAGCHGASLGGLAPAIPGLLGLPRDYIAAQIGAWRSGMRHAAAPDCMADISQRLTPEDIQAVAAWLSTQPVSPSYAPDAVGSISLPLACGSQVIR